MWATFVKLQAGFSHRPLRLAQVAAAEAGVHVDEGGA